MGSGAPIVEELVLLLRDGAQVGQAVTDDGGRYGLLVLADGDYTVALASEGHGTASRALSVAAPTERTGVERAGGRRSMTVSLPDAVGGPSDIESVSGAEHGRAALRDRVC